VIASKSTFPVSLPSGRSERYPGPAHPPCSTLRVFPRGESLHVARLLRPDPKLITALRVYGFVLPALDRDQDRR